MNNKIENLFLENKIEYIKNQNLAVKSTFKIGSTANYFVLPSDSLSFQKAIEITKENLLPFFILGGGSNTVFPDTPYEGVIISTENMKSIEILPKKTANDDDTIYVRCLAGVPMASFIKFCTEHALSGAEQFAGLPGSVGGAVYMNARCFNKSISDIFFSAKYVDELNNSIREIFFDEKEWEYKKSPFQSKSQKADEEHKYVTEVVFSLKQKAMLEKKVIETECKKYISERVDKGHFKYPSAGSVFKNNRSFGKPSGQLIDEAGLKGLREGGAQIAPFHGNFIINVNNAKALDVKILVEKAQEAVKDKFGFVLEPEIIFLTSSSIC